ncbi:MAG: DUF3540 domain-containing protein [Desulfobulbaceae bacterium]|nr:DUF3540 domain-containing protein [Desulfobulbaceae bacterium]
MRNFAPHYDYENKTNLFGQAKVLTVDKDKRTAKIYLNGLVGIQEINAILAIPYDYHLGKGDEVLVAGDSFDAIYVIGILTPKSDTDIYSDNGSRAAVVTNDDTSIIQIYSKHNELVVEYDTIEEKTRVACRDGNLEFAVPDGNISFQSRESIEFSGEAIRFKARKAIETTVQDCPGEPTSSLSLGSHQIKLKCPDLRLTAQRGSFYLEELRITGMRVLVNLIQATIKAERLETRAQTIISKARNIYQTVENLTQLKTGRLKTLIQKSYHLKSKNTVLKSEEDFKIKADKINLG